MVSEFLRSMAEGRRPEQEKKKEGKVQRGGESRAAEKEPKVSAFLQQMAASSGKREEKRKEEGKEKRSSVTWDAGREELREESRARHIAPEKAAPKARPRPTMARPQSSYAAAAGAFPPEEKNPYPSYAAVSGTWKGPGSTVKPSTQPVKSQEEMEPVKDNEVEEESGQGAEFGSKELRKITQELETGKTKIEEGKGTLKELYKEYQADPTSERAAEYNSALADYHADVETYNRNVEHWKEYTSQEAYQGRIDEKNERLQTLKTQSDELGDGIADLKDEIQKLEIGALRCGGVGTDLIQAKQ